MKSSGWRPLPGTRRKNRRSPRPVSYTHLSGLAAGGAGTGGRFAIIGQGHQVRLVHLVQEVDRFLAFIVTVNNQVKDIPGFRFQCNKLLAAAGCAAVIVNQGQVPVQMCIRDRQPARSL